MVNYTASKTLPIKRAERINLLEMNRNPKPFVATRVPIKRSTSKVKDLQNMFSRGGEEKHLKDVSCVFDWLKANKF